MTELDSYHRNLMLVRSRDLRHLPSQLENFSDSVFWGKVHIKHELSEPNPYPNIAEDKKWSKNIMCRVLDHFALFPDKASERMFASVLHIIAQG